MTALGVKFHYFDQKMTRNKGVLLITPKFTPFDDTKELYYGISFKALLYFFKVNQQTIGKFSLYDHHRGQIAIFWPKITQNINILLITPQFEPFGCTKQPQNHIENEAWLNFFISYHFHDFSFNYNFF